MFEIANKKRINDLENDVRVLKMYKDTILKDLKKIKKNIEGDVKYV